MSLTIHNLHYQYGSHHALQGVSMEARPGEITGLLGPNGAGKSTLMRCAVGYLPVPPKTIHIQQHDLHHHPQKCQQHIGYLPEHNPLYDDMYVKEFLTFIGRLHRRKGTARRLRQAELIQACGLTPVAHRPIQALSKGYRQRLGLARSLIAEPSVLILDEPTSGLDPNQLQEIRHLLQQYSHQATIVLSTHVLQEVEALCSQVVLIHEGKKLAQSSLTGFLKEHTQYARIVIRCSPVQATVWKQCESLIIANSTLLNPDQAGAEGTQSEGIQSEGIQSEGIQSWVLHIATSNAATTPNKAAIQQNLQQNLIEFCSKQQITLHALSMEEESLSAIFSRLTKATNNDTSDDTTNHTNNHNKG